MNNEIFFSMLNPAVFYDRARTLLPQYNTKFHKDFPALETLKSWQGYGRYFQKWQNNDTIFLQAISNIGPIDVKLFNCRGSMVRSWQFTRKQKHKRFPDYFIYEAGLALNDLPKGRYQLVILVGNPVQLTLESDWIDIAPVWPNTVLLEYSNSFYYADAIFDTGWSPNFRVEGWFRPKAPTSKDELYTDQTYNQVLLFSDPYQVLTFLIGPSTGVPDWVPESLNWILGCDQVYYDGWQLAKADGAKFEEVREDGVPFRGYAIELQPSKRRASKIHTVTGVGSQKKVLVALNVDTQGFADTTQGSASNVIQITKVD